jgi:hypothetical protein
MGKRRFPLNKQPITVNSPFFQGWLIRSIDHKKGISFIIIIGSFSPKGFEDYKEHYVFCALDSGCGPIVTKEVFPDPQSVRVESSTNDNSEKLDMKWISKDNGRLEFTDDYCKADLSIDGFEVKVNTTARIPWSRSKVSFSGPEGWLEHTNLLPCHYFVHSVGSESNYTFKIEGLNLTGYGQALSHIEGNHGSFFPSGWVWSQGIGFDNSASFSLVIGKFNIGPLVPMTACLHIRRKNEEVVVFRSIDFDQIYYDLDGVSRSVVFKASSKLKGYRIELRISCTDDSKHTVFVPTPWGFSNQPGCQETYRAIATLKLFDNHSNQLVEEYEIPLTALEFGGQFINNIQRNMN